MESLYRKGDTEAYARSNDEFHFYIRRCHGECCGPIKLKEEVKLRRV
jgi:hypothetical protein